MSKAYPSNLTHAQYEFLSDMIPEPIQVYRDEYYNSDSPDRGIAEVILAKHRNGPK